MAKFIKVHHLKDRNEIVEYTVNLEMITAVDEQDKSIDLVDGDSICVTRDNEWNKIMQYVKNNMLT